MGSMGSPKSSTPYDAYKDCAKGICNLYCSQWCNYPPPLDTGDDSGTSFSPLIIAVIGILASAILLVCYYAIITKYCRRRRGFNFRRNRRHHHNNNNVESELHLDQVNNLNQDQWQVNSSGGLDEGLIKSITVFQYKKDVGLVEGTECSVCLNEFQENENLRLLPKCCHAFHPPCIDIWLKSHSNCPLCRANAAPIYTPPNNHHVIPPPPATSDSSQSSSTLNISAMETQRPNDLVFVIDQEELIDNQELCVNGFSDLENLAIIRNKKILDQDGSREFRRTRGGLMVADVLQINEEDEEIKVEIQQKLDMKSMSSSKRVQEEESK